MFSGLLFRLVGFGQDGQSRMKKLLIQAGGPVVQFGADFNILPILMDFSLQSSAAHGKFVSELYIKGDTFYSLLYNGQNKNKDRNLSYRPHLLLKS